MWTWLLLTSTVPHGAAHAATIRKPTSIIEEAFADADLPMSPGPTPLWDPGAVPGEWTDVCGFLKPPDSHERWTVRMHGAFSMHHSTFDLREKIKAACTRHSLTIAETMHRGRSMIGACTSKKDPLRTNSTRKESGHTENKATIRTRRRHPYVYMLPTSTARSSLSDLIRPVHPSLLLFSCDPCHSCTHVTLHVALHSAHMSQKKKKFVG